MRPLMSQTDAFAHHLPFENGEIAKGNNGKGQ